MAAATIHAPTPRGEPAGDRIEIRSLRVEAVHGVHESERNSPQAFEVDLDLYVDTSSASRSDELSETADYSAAVDAAVEVMGGPPHTLLESLAAEIADKVLRDIRVGAVTVWVRKLRPPVEHVLGSAAVRLTRSRGEAG